MRTPYHASHYPEDPEDVTLVQLAVLNVPTQSEIGDLGCVVGSHQNVPRAQVSVNVTYQAQAGYNKTT